MPEATSVELGKVQQTLFFPLLARARETRSKRPLLRDPKALKVVRALNSDLDSFRSPMRFLVIIRTMILDWWIRQFLAEHPGGTVVELGAGLNARFERTDNGSVHWIDLDLPDTIELRRRFFTDTGRRRMLTASLTDEDWLPQVEALPGPYFFTADGVLPYLREEEVTNTLSRLSARFPASLLAFDSYPRVALEWEHKMAARRDLAYWQWSCDDPRTLERLGLRLLESVTATRPPAGVLAELPARYRYLLPLADPFLGRGLRISLFRSAPAPAGQSELRREMARNPGWPIAGDGTVRMTPTAQRTSRDDVLKIVDAGSCCVAATRGDSPAEHAGLLLLDFPTASLLASMMAPAFRGILIDFGREPLDHRLLAEGRSAAGLEREVRRVRRSLASRLHLEAPPPSPAERSSSSRTAGAPRK